MLIRFSVRNFRCFRDQTTLELTASSDKLIPGNVYQSEDGRTRILRSAGIYGSNASGKTTVFGALSVMRDFIVTNIPGGMDRQFNYTPFAFDNNRDPTSFEAEFIHDGVRQIYGFSYDANRICEEHLYTFPNGRKKTVFERKLDEYVFKSDLRMRNDVAKRMDSKKLYVSFASQFNDQDCRRVVDWFSSRLLVLVGFNIDVSLEILFSTMQRDERFRSYVLKALRIADFGISDLSDHPQIVNVAPSSVPMTLHDYRARHTFNDKHTSLPLLMESGGTIRFMSVIGPVIQALTNGSTVAIDEMDMSFHTDLTKWIVGLFHDPEENRTNAQIIFNTHDVELLDQSIVRRDQVWITSKDDKTGAARIDNLKDFRIRNDLDIRKAFLNGSLGGTPFIEPERLI
jgi:hypothetical protein